jgi:ABC-2 type transport system permease protein
MSDETTRLDAFLALCVARFREFYREPEVVFWSFIFPIILAVGLGIAFRNRPAEVLPVAVLQGPQGEELARVLEAAPLLKVQRLPEAEAQNALRMGRVAVVVVPGADVAYRLDPSRPESLLARDRVDDAVQRAAGRQDPRRTRAEEVSEPGSRYIDFLLPGIIGMNLMSGGMWGVGFNLVDMRIKRLLKRLLATPMHRSDFMLAQMTTRLVFMFLETTFVLGLGRILFQLPIRGSWLAVFAIGGLGALTFGGMGLLVACRAQRIEAVMGLMNVVMMPMFICSGVFFSADRFPAVIQPAIRALPLTALIDALRAVVLEGATLLSQATPLAILAGWGVLSFVVGLRFFRWN